MISNSTARKVMYEWHTGQKSAMYAAASSGLVANWDDLVQEIDDMGDENGLMEWCDFVRFSGKLKNTDICGQSYAMLPWCERKA